MNNLPSLLFVGVVFFMAMGVASAQTHKERKMAVWPQEEENQFIQECTAEAMEGVRPEKQQRYCACTLKYLQMNYTFEENQKEQALFEKQPNTQPAGMIKAAAHCTDQLLSMDEFMTIFMYGCMENTPEGVSKEKQEEFCGCSIAALKARNTYPELVEFTLTGSKTDNPMKDAMDYCQPVLKRKNDSP